MRSRCVSLTLEVMSVLFSGRACRLPTCTGGGPALAFWQSPTLVRESVPDRRGDGALGAALVQTFKNCRVRCLRDRGRNDACVQKVTERHRDTLRPVVLSRVEVAQSSSTPIASKECLSR